MPPSVKTTKDRIIAAACEICRRDGIDAINARGIARVLGTSTQPIFSNFSGMEELLSQVKEAAQARYLEYVRLETERAIYPPYKSSGMAYIRFAREEREYFKLLFMQRAEENAPREEVFDPIVRLVQNNLGITAADAERMHLTMWVFVHGLATLEITSTLSLAEEDISQMLTNAYIGLKHAYQYDDK